MNYKILSILFSAFLFVSFTGFSQTRAKWEKLGVRAVNYKIDKDDIHVGAKEGGFTKLKVVVTGGSVNMHKMVVTYMNGEKEEITLRHNFKKGSGSRIIDLKGGKRLIKNIRFFYDTKNIAKSRAKVIVFGRK
ncbi:MAG: hypothetical protein HRT58_04745 [Crocinitomicaceae bacterium]|nr:hypothetical protein [Flavobacteriales bacterium]NQZ34946.1 hypothetical protein [Crocinitomicaceae bacterium]